MKRRSDRPLTIALSLSLAAHAGLGSLLLRARIAELTRELYHPPITPAELVKRDAPEPPDPEPLLAEAPPQTVQDFAFAEPPKTPKPPTAPPTKSKTQAEENSEWGEKDATGIAVTSAPGQQDMQAKKGNQDQSFASRDPEGPQPRPDQPSMSTALPGQDGDGKRALQQAAAAMESQTDPSDLIGNATKAPVVPPPPPPKRFVLARDDRGDVTPETSGRSASVLPSAERRSPAEPNSPPAERDALPNDVAWGNAAQLLPIKRPDVIAIPSRAQAYPDVVAALTRPPGIALASDPLKTLDAPVLSSTVAAEHAASPAIQVATSPIAVPGPVPEEVALRVGETLPSGGPAIVEALTRPPDQLDLTGGTAALPEVVSADEPSGPAIADAIAGDEPDRPNVEELAERIESSVPPTPQATPSTEPPRAAAAPAPTPAAVANARGGLPGPAAEAADPAPDTGFESDPFSKIPGVEFRNGKVDARSGRQIKPVRPRLSETAQRDLLGLQFPTILAKVRIDKTGKVTDVIVLRGSGSQAVDQPVYRALWNWWFEPPRDKKGNPMEDVQLVAIHWG